MTLSKFQLADTLTALQLFCSKLHEHLPHIYLLYALPAVVLATWITPPFQVPDEPHHFCRAEQISRGELVAFFHTDGLKEARTIADERVLMPDIGGYSVNNSAPMFASVFLNISSRKNNQVRKSHLNAVKEISWGSEITYVNFTNTAMYPPTGYLVVVAGILAGKMVNASVMNTFYLARLLNGIFCTLLCFYALRLTKASRLLLFTVLLFPMTITLFASVSQDGLLVSLALLFFAIIGQVESSDEKQYSQWQLIVLVTAIVAISTSRPPYFLFSFLFFFLNLSKRTRLICFLASLVSVILWGLLNQRNYGVVWAAPELKINAPLQIEHILADPIGFVGLFFKFNFVYIRTVAHEFVGILGWKELFLPDSFYSLALFAFLFAAIVSTYYNFKERLRLRSALFVAAIASVIAIIIIQYITWMPLEAPYLGGVQGRYFIPLFPAVALALAGFQKNIAIKKWQTPLVLGVITFPIISMVVLISQLIEGYYMVD